VILVDMIADAHLDIRRDAHSTPWLSDIVFAQARRLGYGRYFLNSRRAIEDDHVPLLELGIPAVDIIDLDYWPFNVTGILDTTPSINARRSALPSWRESSWAL
jgi:hypothetical protein